MSRKLLVLLVVPLFVLAFSGCESESSETKKQLPNAMEVPKPAAARSAVVVEDKPDYASYEMPRSWDFKKLLSFYDKEMPVGKNWEGWTWCGAQGGRKASDTYFSRLYRTPKNLQLNVSVLWEDSGLVGAIVQRDKLGANPEPC